ncbi:MAG: PilZ domain-containing protein [Candidatus Omnitrophica bacterium]|nr:PilZ domain-containing protein [Candidatus Omnitrophota bacterium]
MEDFLRFDEKRKSPRFRVSLPFEYKKLRGTPEMKKGSVTKDLSLGGTRFVIDEFLPYTARLVLDITLPLPQRSVSAISKVSWIRKLSSGDKYEVGNQFLEMSREDRERLSLYLDGLGASGSSR